LTNTLIGNTSNVSLAPRLLPYGGTPEFFCADNVTGIQVPTANLTFVNSNSPESVAYVQTGIVGLENVSVNCTYNSTNFANAVWQNMNNSEVAIGSWSDWEDIIVIAAMAGIILAIILGLLAVQSSRKAY